MKRKGIALLLVVIMLAALAALAVPFAASMRQQEVAARKFKYDTQSRLAAGAATEWARGYLTRSIDSLEAAKAATSPFDTPNSDAEWELAVLPLDEKTPSGVTAAKAMGFGTDEDGIDTVLALAAEDESGKIDLNSASPWLIGNLFASTVTMGRADSGDTSIDVESTFGFPTSGTLMIGGELVGYTRKNDTSFQGLQRGKSLSWAFESRSPGRIAEGALVIDARAYVVAKQHLLVDENTNSLPLRTVTEVRSSLLATVGAGILGAADLEPYLSNLTVNGGRFHAAGWYSAQALVADPEHEDDGGWTLPIRYPIHYGIGSAIRVTAGHKRFHGHVVGFKFDGEANTLVPIVDVPLGQVSREGSIVEVEERAPININSAPFRVLVACLLGVSGNPKDSVNLDEAAAIAQAIIDTRREAPIGGLGDYRSILANVASQSLSALDREALFLNAQVPGHYSLRVGTTSFSFTSADRYTLDASVKMLGAGGRELGSYRQRESVFVAWPDDVVWGVESQRDFREFVNRFGWMNLMSTGPTALACEDPVPDRLARAFIPYGQNVFPSEDRDQGYVVLTAAREEDGESDQVSLEHFAGAKDDAFNLDDTAYPLALGALFQPAPGGTARTLAPGRIEFWVKPSAWIGSQGYLCDIGENEYQNRLAVYYDSANDWLVFRMGETAAGIVPQTTSPELLPAWTEVRFPMHGIGLQVGHWHHVAIEWTGNHYGEMALLVDGIAHVKGHAGATADPAASPDSRVGFTYVTSNPGVSPLTFLSSDIGPDDVEIEVENAEAFGVRGALRIGGEIVLFDNAGQQGNTLKIVPENAQSQLAANWWDKSESPTRIFLSVQRGLYGTRAAEHTAGEPVYPAGYSAPLVAWLPPATTPGSATEEESTDPEAAPSQPGYVTSNFNQAWDWFADPWTFDHSGSAPPPGSTMISPTNGIIEQLDPAFGLRCLYLGGARIREEDYTGGYLGNGGNLALPNSYCLTEDERAQLGGAAGFTLPDPADIMPEDEIDWVRVWSPLLTHCELVDPQLVGTDDVVLLEATSTSLDSSSPLVASSRTGSWPTEGYAVLMSISWQGAPGGGRMRGGPNPAGGMCVPWVDAFQSVMQGVAGSMGAPLPPGFGGGNKPYEYVRYTLDDGGAGTSGVPGGPPGAGAPVTLNLEERGLFGTSPLEVSFNPTMTPYKEVWAFPISIAAHYSGTAPVWEAYAPSGFIQIEDEWIEYYFYRYDKSTQVIHFITPIWEKIIDNVTSAVKDAMSGGTPIGPGALPGMGSLISSIIGTNRGQANTLSMPHPRPNSQFAVGGTSTLGSGSTAPNARQVVPVFLVRGEAASPYDAITIVDQWNDDVNAGGTPCLASVHWRHPRAGGDPMTWVALDAGAPRSFLAEGRARILKFPSGETPELYTQPANIGGENLAGAGTARMGSGPSLGMSAMRYLEALPFLLPPSGLGAATQTASYDTPDLGAVAGIPVDGSGEATQSVRGLLDEVRVRSSNTWQTPDGTTEDGRRLVLRVASPTSGSTPGDADTIQLGVGYDRLQALGVKTDGGIVKIGDELIAFRSSASSGDNLSELTGCHRGFLGENSASGTDGLVIGDGQPVFFLKYADMTQLDTGMGGADAIVPILSSEDLRKQDGHVLIDGEIVGYTSAGSTVLQMPARAEDQEGLYRGRFGTTASGHDSGAIVYELPFRYWDRYAEEADDPSMAFVQVVRSQPETEWKNFSWKEEIPGAYLDVVCLARFGGEPDWAATPSNAAGGLFRFEAPPKGASGYPVRSQLELRFLMRYLPGAYENSHDWKDTPTLRAVYTEYRSRAMVLDHEEIR